MPNTDAAQPTKNQLLANMQAVIARKAAEDAAKLRQAAPVVEDIPAAALITVERAISLPRANTTGYAFLATQAEAEAAAAGIYDRFPSCPYGTSVRVCANRNAWQIAWRVWNAD